VKASTRRGGSTTQASRSAALELTEAATRLTEGGVSDEVFARATKHFDDVQLAELIWTITVINAWNRLGCTARPWPLEVSSAG